MKVSRLVLLTTLFCYTLTLSGRDIRVSTSAHRKAFVIASPATQADIVVAENDAEVVSTAARCLSSDVKAITGQALDIHITAIAGAAALYGRQPIIAGTLGQSVLIDSLAAAGKIDAEAVRGRWEVYGLQMVKKPFEGTDRALVIYGSTPRGTAYGLLELSLQMGVSPYIWWADVGPARHNALYIQGEKTISEAPAVRYRGIFINDEDWGLMPWAAKTLDKVYGNIGANTYAKVMELLLRLRANTLWPAMHPCSQAFWDNKDNMSVARKYDIMLGSSHCEQMLRDNEWEWRRAPWNGTNESWNYANNAPVIRRYWEERVAESKGYDAMYTLGMRGVHDWGISGYPTTDDKVRGLTEIIGFQRSLLRKYIGDPTQIPQLFIPYKEVLDAYNAGLHVPEDVTLCWVDDNHGYIRQLPLPSEQARPGGNGIYYHLSYWGSPHDYLWLCSHSPSLISYELSRAYAQGIQTLWIINVGDIKPAEAELEFCMDLAWDADAWAPENAWRYMRYWASKTFGEAVADEIAAIKREYYRLAAGGKPEHVFAISYSDAERERRISAYASLAAAVETLRSAIPPRLQDAYYQLIEYPVKGAYCMNVKEFRATQSLALASQGQREQALAYAREAHRAYEEIQALTARYNTDIAHGKWNGMMSAAPRGLKQFRMPQVATDSMISSPSADVPEEPRTVVVPASDYTAAHGHFTVMEGLGISDRGVTIWPLDMTRYTTGDAPSLEYEIPVRQGENTLSVRCLPTFPVNTTYDLRVALSVDNGPSQVISLKTEATKGKWNRNVLQGFNEAAITYHAEKDKKVRVRVGVMDPGVVVCEIQGISRRR
ncbi:MAG: glycosyl hydrolase 115 family protein [Bacteroidales bacterium]|nr:glycosyl hydrolase 115 family protein [Bacteroidales bacterium]